MRKNLTSYVQNYDKALNPLSLKNILSYSFITLIYLLTVSHSFATVGDPGVHDPSTVVKCGNRYYTFTTGGNVPMKSSPDLISWKSEGSVFSNFPSWIKTYAPAFNGNFWAPDVIFMNNKYYVYYSCFNPGGDAPAAIGLVTNPTLDKSSPNYKWTDQGMVVYSSTKRDIVAIDASIYKDGNRVFMAYGTYPGNGMGIVELDPVSGKVKAGDKLSRVSHNSEAAGLIKVGNYFYLFHNHGSCCSGTNSTYYITCGRSTNPKGPYLDANGGDMADKSYGTDVIKRSGKYYGPGHFALFKENGIEIVSYHYYDADNNGRSKIGFGKLIWVNGWPKVTRDWLDNGNFSIVGSESGKAWEANIGTGAITQNTQSRTNTAQRWNFTKLGEGIYTITASNGKVAEISGCSNTNGAKLQLGTAANSSCQKYFIERTASGAYVIEPLNSINATTNFAKMIGAVGNATSNSASLETRDYNGAASQRWNIVPFGTIVTGMEDELAGTISEHTKTFPNPFISDFTISRDGDFEYAIYDVTGCQVENGKGSGSVKVAKSLLPGIYLVKVSNSNGSDVLKVTKN